MIWLLLVSAALLALAALFIRRTRRRTRRARLFHAPLTPNRRALLARLVPASNGMPPALRARLEGCINVFLAEKRLVGCDGFPITEEVRIAIAGNACLLLLHGGERCFPGCRTVLVYPDTFVAPRIDYDGDIVIEGREALAGESWEGGPVVLSWRDIERDLASRGGGRNVVIHEFAHKLDEENDLVDGLPVLRDDAHYSEWAEVLSREYQRLGGEDEPPLDEYALTSPAEFFAVAAEEFFGAPARMRERLPDLYAQLSRYFGVDPAAWGGRPGL